MNDERDSQPWPAEAGEPGALPTEMTPPTSLEDRVVAELLHRQAIVLAPRKRSTRRAALVGGLAVAASLTLLMLGFLVGRQAARPFAGGVPASPTTAQYALLLYETESYDRAEGAEVLERYNEYSRWVAQARSAGQFVTGEDLATDRGWILDPDSDSPQVRTDPSVDAAPVLSGVFLINADEPEQALALAGRLPHLRHGGHVVVQQTVPTDQPPTARTPPSKSSK